MMKKAVFLLAALLLVGMTACTRTLALEQLAALPSEPAASALEPTEMLPSATPLPLPSPTEVAQEPQAEATTEVPAEAEAQPEPDVAARFPWPVGAPSEEQVQDARSCDLANLPRNRYVGEIAIEELRDAYEPETACDWAVLALAYLERLGEDEAIPPAALEAYLQAIGLNPAIALRTQIFYDYFGQVDQLVDAPPIGAQEIVGLRIEYDWNGLGQPISYRVEISQADTVPLVSGEVTVKEGPVLQPAEGDEPLPSPTPAVLPPTMDPAKIQALSGALTDLWPAGAPFNLFACVDNFPEWVVALSLADGRVVEVVTVGSNYLTVGGPWQTSIEGQHYVQLSPDFLLALIGITETLGLPFGQPLSMSCTRDQAMFDFAYPQDG